MAKAPKDPKEIFSNITEDYAQLFGDDLISIILYGSGASVDYVPGRSDVNIMIVLSETGIESLDLTFEVIDKWKKRNVATPLFLTEEYVRTSQDVFPLEYLNFKNNHRTIYGKDILKDLSFDRRFLRLQCERELKGKLLLLREAFLETRGKGKNLQQLIEQSVHAFIAIFSGLLYLKGEEVPGQKREIVRLACKAFDVDRELFENLLNIKEKKIRPTAAELTKLFKSYLSEVKKLWQLVDTLPTEPV